MKGKTQNGRVWSKGRFIDREGASREDETPNGALDPAPSLDPAKGFKRAGGQVLVGGPWSWATYSKEMSTPDLPGQLTLGF